MHPTLKIEGVKLLISETAISHLDYPVQHSKWHAYFFITYNYLSNIMVSSTTCQHLVTTSLVTHVTNAIQHFVKCGIKSCVHLNFRPDNMLFGRLQPITKRSIFQKVSSRVHMKYVFC